MGGDGATDTTNLLQHDEERVEELVVLGEMEEPHPVVQLAAVEALLGVAVELEKCGALLSRHRERERRDQSRT